MPEQGHVSRLLPVIEGLSARGVVVHVMTDARFRPVVERHGGRFFDLFGRFPIEAADPTSIPVPSRYVTFAATYFDPLLEIVASLEPRMIVYDTFAVIGPILGRRLAIPYVNCCAGHASVPSRRIAATRASPQTSTSPACRAAVRLLQERHGLEQASPFSFFDGLSPFLNLYGEPPAFLDDADRAIFEPVAFLGSLSPSERDAASAGGTTPFESSGSTLRVYVSFGTVVWRYFEAVAHAALDVLSDALSGLDAEVCIGLGGHSCARCESGRPLRANVKVERYVDQWAVLREAHLFVTHHGLNSTHESIYHGAPMISYPFFGDQPDQARRCQELGLAVPLVPTPQAPFGGDDVLTALDGIAEHRSAFDDRLAQARGWELETLAARSAVIDRLVALMRA